MKYTVASRCFKTLYIIFRRDGRILSCVFNQLYVALFSMINDAAATGGGQPHLVAFGRNLG